MINYYNYIKKWDEHDCVQHVEPFLNKITPILQNYYQRKPVIYIDIGENVGKVYDLIKQKNILNLDSAYLFEASIRLYKYIKTKYKYTNNVYIFNDIILDQSININFDDTYVDHCISNNDTYINFGLSKINPHKKILTRQTKQISDFLQEYGLFNKNLFIKIDTENSDFLILKNILSIINKFKCKPIIEFEINYIVGGHSIEFAQSILDEYSNKYQYQKINLNNISGDGLLVPKK